MQTYIVIAYFNYGFTVKGTGLTFEEAHDMREALVALNIYRQVSVGAVGSYFNT